MLVLPPGLSAEPGADAAEEAQGDSYAVRALLAQAVLQGLGGSAKFRVARAKVR